MKTESIYNYSIPPIVHYCWFGNSEKPQAVTNYVDNWKRLLPGYQFIEWNESNFDVHRFKYTEEAYENKKWAFVADVARICALYERGGIYLDTDVELIKPFDELLKQGGAVFGFETPKAVATAFLAAPPQNAMIHELLLQYEKIAFIDEDGTINYKTITTRLTDLCQEHGLQLNNQFQALDDFCVYPMEYFSPKDFMTGKVNTTAKSFMIHHFDGSWIPADIKKQVDFWKKSKLEQKFLLNYYTIKGEYKQNKLKGVSKLIKNKVRSKIKRH